ncbi:helix-turn-helix domain-containing protein [Leucobacter chromiiresistens]|nr:helix-turn-helix transcriptional regulator [Leucobacter chromiiresistens]
MQIERPSQNIGKRIAFYRQMNGMSAAELSERTLGAISKGVIANIETGRKKDLTVDELITLSWALGVPPVAIALPIDTPFGHVKIAEGKDEVRTVNVSNTARWFVAPAVPFQADFKSAMQDEETAAGALATSRITALFRWWSDFLQTSKLRRKIKLAAELNEETESFEERLKEAEEDLAVDVQRMILYRMDVRDDG